MTGGGGGAMLELMLWGGVQNVALFEAEKSRAGVCVS